MLAVLTVLLTALTALALSPVASAAPAADQQADPKQTDQEAAAEQVLVFTADDSVGEYTSAPATATAGPATIVFENSTETGNTTGMPHTLTFSTTREGYNSDVDVDILANPYDANGGRWEVEVDLSPGTYYYYCTMAGHTMSGELVVTEGGGGDPDTTAPEVGAEVTGDQDAEGNYVGAATITATATDADSGVANIEYEIDDTGFRHYTDPVTVTEPGDHTVQVRATDNAGNTSDVQSVPFTVVEDAPPADTTPPQVTAEVTGDQDAEGNYVGAATITATATDADSGVANIEYEIDDTGFRDYTDPVTVTEPGDHTVQVRASDNAGNTSDVQSVPFTVVEDAPPADTTPPQVTAEVTGDQDADGSYIDSATVTLDATDADSGVASIEYALDGGDHAPYTDPVTITGPGEHTIAYRATDTAGNTSESQTSTITVVESAPPEDDGPCPGDPAGDTVTIDGTDTGVADVDTGDGCSVSELVRPWASYDTHGEFVTHVGDVTSGLVEDDVLSAREAARIKQLAARSDIGRDLELTSDRDPMAGWSQAGPGSFTDEGDGVIASRGGMGLLWYEAKELGEYTLHLDFRLTEENNNSGVFVGFPDVGDDPWVAVREGEEIQINDNPGGDPQKTGAVYNEQGAQRDASRPVGEWNSYDIVVREESITVYLNGTQVNNWVDDDPAVDLSSGFVGLQNHDPTPVEFRDVSVNEVGR